MTETTPDLRKPAVSPAPCPPWVQRLSPVRLRRIVVLSCALFWVAIFSLIFS